MSLLLFAWEAQAWTHTGFALRDEDFPRRLGISGAPAGMSEGEAMSEIQAAADTWAAASCGRVEFELVTIEAAERDSQDGDWVVTFDDPRDEIEAGIAGVSYTVGSGETLDIQGTEYDVPFDVDVVFNDEPFATQGSVVSGDCEAAFSLQAVATHELGHVLGLGHSCDQAEDCGDDGLAASMYWEPLRCDAGPAELGSDDLRGLLALYATPVDFACSPVADQPLAVSCVADEATLTEVTWDFGDGVTATGASVTHTYAEGGAYGVRVCGLVAGCDEVTCFDTTVYAVAAGTAEAEGPTAASDCGCDQGGENPFPSALALGLLALVYGPHRGRGRGRAVPVGRPAR